MAAVIAKTKKRPFSFPIRFSTIFYTLMLALLFVLVAYPLFMLLLNSFVVAAPDGKEFYGFGNWIMAWSQTGIIDAVTNTFSVAVATILLSSPLAILLAWLLNRTDIPGREYLDFFLWMAFFLPTLPVLMGWILLMDSDFGLINQAIVKLFGVKKGPFNIYSYWGIVWAHLVTRSVVSKYIFLSTAFNNLDSSLEEASLVAGRSTMGTLIRIVLPVLTPVICITLIVSLIHSLEAFEIERVLGPPFNFYVFSTKIFRLVQEEPPLYGAATVLSLAILACLLPMILLQHHLSAKRSYVTVTSHFKRNIVRLRVMRWPAFCFVCGFCVVITVVPLVFMVMGTFMNLFGYFNIEHVWTLNHWKRVLHDPILIKSIVNTLKMAGSAAFLGVLFYTILSYISVRTKYAGRGIVDFLTWLPVTIPGIILGLGLLWMFLGTPFFRPLYGTIVILIVAMVISSMTTGTQLIKANMIQLGRELEEASAVSGGSLAYTFRRVIVPILAPALISVGTLIFIHAARNIAAIAMIVTGENRPLAMLQLDYMVDGSYESAAIAGVIIVVLTMGMAIIARMIGRNVGIRR